jgi:hypothetical protein
MSLLLHDVNKTNYWTCENVLLLCLEKLIAQRHLCFFEDLRFFYACKKFQFHTRKDMSVQTDLNRKVFFEL